MAGDVDPKAIIDSILPIEKKIISKNIQYKKFRPWTRPVPPLKETIEKTVYFASDDEKYGSIVYLAWREDVKWTDFMERTALNVLWEYLTFSSVSPLRKAFVELQDQYCGEISAIVTDTNPVSQYVKFSNVPSKKAKLIKDRFFDTLNEICNQGIDMKRMLSILNRTRIKVNCLHFAHGITGCVLI